MSITANTQKGAVARTPLRRRIFFAVGPGDAVAAYEHWRMGVRMPSETALTFSGQTLDFCRDHGCAAMLVSWCERATQVSDGLFVIENRPKSSRRLGYFLREAAYAFSLAISAWRYGAETAVIDSGSSEWFMLWPFKFFGITVVPNFHNTYHPECYPPKRWSRRAIAMMDRSFFRRVTRVALGVSPACARQYLRMAGPEHRAVEYRAQFVQSDFVETDVPNRFAIDDANMPFNILYVGRIERTKGVFDLLDIAQQLRADGRRAFQIDVCGDGSELPALRSAVADRNLSDLVKLHGRLDRVDLMPAYRRSHLVIVPTRSDFCEGMNLVCVEAVLHGRPVVTSRVVPALELLGDAAVEADTDKPSSYAHRISTLMLDLVEYRRRVAACNAAGLPFFDRSFGLARALQKVFARTDEQEIERDSR